MGKPKIRFKGYEDDWEQRKFGDLYCKVSEKNDLSFGSDKIISVANMYFKEDVKDSSEEYMRTYNVMRLGDIAFEGNKSKNYAHGRFVENTIGDGIVSHVFDVFRPIAEYDLYFWKYLINNEDVMGRIMTRCTKASTMMTNLVTNDFLKEEIMVPSLDEQRKIGKYLDDLDNLITLHQRKCEETKSLKKYMLQKMFPENGKCVPKIRFSGFSDAWEQRKVTDLGEIYIGLVTTMTEHYTDKGHLLIRNSDIKDGYFEFGENPIYLDGEFSEQNKSRMHQLGDVITVHTGDIGTSAVIGENEVNSIGFATIVTRPNQKILDSNYFATYLNTDTHKQWAISMATGDGRSNYNLKDYTKLVVPIPQIEEQKKIATCIGNLNNLITLHQHKCDELQKLKKFMLQNMFVQQFYNDF